MDWIESLTLGAVQGLTEFLPISSDGHLLLTSRIFRVLTGHARTAEELLFFFVMLHLGTLAATALHYRAVIRTGSRGLLNDQEVPPEYRRGALIHVGWLAIVATLTLLPYAVLKDYLKETLESETAVGYGFVTTATVLIVTLFLRGGDKGAAETRWWHALLIGIAQTFAPLPGVSRSGLTIATALSLGLSKTWAVGFSLLIAFPAILGATVMEIKDVDPTTLTTDRLIQTGVATLLAGLVGYLAIIWLVKIVRAGKLWYFSVYLYLLALLVLTTSLLSGGNADATGAKATERTAWVRTPGPTPR